MLKKIALSFALLATLGPSSAYAYDEWQSGNYADCDGDTTCLCRVDKVRDHGGLKESMYYYRSIYFEGGRCVSTDDGTSWDRRISSRTRPSVSPTRGDVSVGDVRRTGAGLNSREWDYFADELRRKQLGTTRCQVIYSTPEIFQCSADHGMVEVFQGTDLPKYRRDDFVFIHGTILRVKWGWLTDEPSIHLVPTSVRFVN